MKDFNAHQYMADSAELEAQKAADLKRFGVPIQLERHRKRSYRPLLAFIALSGAVVCWGLWVWLR